MRRLRIQEVRPDDSGDWSGPVSQTTLDRRARVHIAQSVRKVVRRDASLPPDTDAVRLCSSSVERC